MGRNGSQLGLLDDRHAIGCDGQEYSTCRPVAAPARGDSSREFKVLFMVWCGDCGAADWDWV